VSDDYFEATVGMEDIDQSVKGVEQAVRDLQASVDKVAISVAKPDRRIKA